MLLIIASAVTFGISGWVLYVGMPYSSPRPTWVSSAKLSTDFHNNTLAAKERYRHVVVFGIVQRIGKSKGQAYVMLDNNIRCEFPKTSTPSILLSLKSGETVYFGGYDSTGSDLVTVFNCYQPDVTDEVADQLMAITRDASQ